MNWDRSRKFAERACVGPFLNGHDPTSRSQSEARARPNFNRMRGCLLYIPLLFGPSLHGQPPPGYYDQAAGLTGTALLEAFNDIISGHTVLPNNALWAAFELTDSKDDGSVWDMYSDDPASTPAYTYQFVTDQCGTYDSEGDCFNREHSFPQSWYGSLTPMSTDLFHLYPTDAWVNQQRGNWPYGKVTSPDWTSINGSKRGPCAWPGCTGTVFEPIDAYKGDLARSYFYMLTRYLPQLDQWTSPMMASGELSEWAESLLLSWHTIDPVSPKEIERNNTVFALQHNRNPYIDQPELVYAIWGPEAGIYGTSIAPPRIWAHGDVLVVDLEREVPWAFVRVMDLSGRMVMAAALTEERSEHALNLAPGAYVVVVITRDLVSTTSIIH